MSKKYITDQLEDSTGSTGSTNQVLTKAAGGVAWASGSGIPIIGGPYLPLAGGTLTGNLTISNASPALNLTDTDNASNIAFSSIGGALVVNSASDQVYQIAGSEKMRIVSGGNVGIGTTSPAAKLDVNGNANFGGNVTIATGGSSELSLKKSDAGVAKVSFVSASVEKSYLELDASEDMVYYAAGGVKQTFYSNAQTTLTLDSQDATFAGDINLNNGNGIIIKDNGGAFRDVIKLATNNQIQIGSSAIGANIRFLNTGNYTFENGSVGIGTTTPGTINGVAFSSVGLHVKAGTLGRTITEGTSFAEFIMNHSNASANQKIKFALSKAGVLELGSMDDNGTRRTQMSILNDGNVGIGTTSPSAKLEVNGSIKILSGGSFAAGVTFGGAISLQNNIAILNKGQTAYIPFATRVTSGLEAAMVLSNVGSATFAGDVTITEGNLTLNKAVNPYLYLNDTNGGAAIFQQSGNDTRIGSDSNTQVQIVQNNAVAVTISTSKNVGIGTTAPAATLTINDSVASSAPQTDSNNLLLIENTNPLGSCNIRLRGGDGATRIMYGENSGATDKLFITPRANDGNHILFDPTGNVSIETAGNGLILKSPNGTQYKITVANDGTITSTAV